MRVQDNMKQIAKNGVDRIERLAGGPASERERVVIGLCLLVVVGLMLVKVPVGRTPETVRATSAPQREASQTQVNVASEVGFLELPELAGRNDVLVRDFFSAEGWTAFETQESVEAASQDGGQTDGQDSSGGGENVRR